MSFSGEKTTPEGENRQKCEILHFSDMRLVLTWGTCEKCNLPCFLKDYFLEVFSKIGILLKMVIK